MFVVFISMYLNFHPSVQSEFTGLPLEPPTQVWLVFGRVVARGRLEHTRCHRLFSTRRRRCRPPRPFHDHKCFIS